MTYCENYDPADCPEHMIDPAGGTLKEYTKGDYGTLAVYEVACVCGRRFNKTVVTPIAEPIVTWKALK